MRQPTLFSTTLLSIKKHSNSETDCNVVPIITANKVHNKTMDLIGGGQFHLLYMEW